MFYGCTWEVNRSEPVVTSLNNLCVKVCVCVREVFSTDTWQN